MNKNMQSNSELKYIFANINDWLKFAEAKHGGLIILNSGLVIGVLSSYGNIQPFICKPILLFGVICFCISVFLSLISQFPATQNVFYKKSSISNPNLYFFGHLSQMDNQTFIDELQKIDAGFTANKLDDDLINQILINARIAQAKYSIFMYSMYLTVISSFVIGFSSTIKVIWLS